jgi:hypothetical protein
MHWEHMAQEVSRDVLMVSDTTHYTSNDELTTNSTYGRAPDRHAAAWYYITRPMQTGNGERQPLVERNVATRSVQRQK